LLIVPIGISDIALPGSNARSEIFGNVRREAELEPAGVPQPSRASFFLNIPFKKIEAGFNLYVFTFKSSGRLAGLASYDTILTLGRISLGQSPDAPSFFRVTAPFTIKGAVGGFDLQESGTAAIDIAFVIENDWCPLIQIGATSVSLKDKVRPAGLMPTGRPVSDFVATTILKQELQKAFECAKLRAAIAEAWRSDYFTILSAPKKLFMNVDPQSISLSGATVDHGAMQLTGFIEVIATVGTSSQRSSRKLPSPGTVSGAETRVSSEIELTLSFNPEIGKR
jgi:hypothetical protein